LRPHPRGRSRRRTATTVPACRTAAIPGTAPHSGHPRRCPTRRDRTVCDRRGGGPGAPQFRSARSCAPAASRFIATAPAAIAHFPYLTRALEPVWESAPVPKTGRQ
jgi:hypothetical protein